MNGDELDALLERYRVAHSRIAANLVDLDNHRAYEILSNGDVGPATVGRVGAALEAAPLLWRWLTQLGDIVDRAGELRQQGRPRGERAQQLRELLAGRSVVEPLLRADPDTSTGIGRHGLGRRDGQR